MSFRRRALGALLGTAMVATLPAVAANQVGVSSVEYQLPAGAGLNQPFEFTVTYDPAQVSGKQIARAASSHGARARVFTQFPVVAVIGNAGAIAAVAGTPGVSGMHPNEKLELHLNAGPHAMGVDAVRRPVSAGGLGVDGTGVVVGVIDSGADATHPDLANRMHRNVKVGVTWLNCEGDPDPNTNPSYDEDDMCDDGEWQPDVIDMKGTNGDTSSGHGTHVSGIIAGDGTASNGLYTGVAPGAKLNSVGTGDVANIFWALEGFEYLLKHAEEDNLVAINNSYGGSRATATTDSAPPSPTSAVRVAAEAAIGRGIAVIWSAGNSGTDTAGTTNNCGARPNSFINSYALIPGVISVAASTRDGAAITDFSSCGRVSDTAHDPTVSAPGGDIVSARGKAAYYVDPLQTSNGLPYIAASGTSMAAPHVAGVVALIQSARQGAGLPKLTPAQIKTLLVSTADPIPNVYSRKQGAGLVDAAAAVAQGISAAAPARADLCHSVQDPDGDATQAVVNTVVSQVPSLDVTSASLSVQGSDLVGTIKVKDLSLLDLGGVNGLYYDFNFQIQGTDAKNGESISYYLAANYSRAKARVSTANPASSSAGANVFSYNIGRYATTRTGLAAGTGSFDEATDTITVRVPLSRISGETTVYDLNGKTLNTIQVVSRRDLHSIIADADTAWGTERYLVGDAC